MRIRMASLTGDTIGTVPPLEEVHKVTLAVLFCRDEYAQAMGREMGATVSAYQQRFDPYSPHISKPW